MLTVYGDVWSGNCYKVKLVLTQLGQKFEWVPVDIMKSESRTPGFLAKNPNGRVPTLELDDGTCLAESNAILWYLAEGSPLIPDSRLARAQTLQWMFFEQYSHEPNIATSRYIIRYLGNPPEKKEALAARVEPGYAALGVMERHLKARGWMAGENYSIADIALYAYTHCAGEGGFDLGRFPAIRAWLARVESQPFYTAMG
jgi:glutathione S-transferase